MEGRRKNKETFSILGCRIILFFILFFFLYVRCQFVSNGQKIFTFMHQQYSRNPLSKDATSVSFVSCEGFTFHFGVIYDPNG